MDNKRICIGIAQEISDNFAKLGMMVNTSVSLLPDESLPDELGTAFEVKVSKGVHCTNYYEADMINDTPELISDTAYSISQMYLADFQIEMMSTYYTQFNNKGIYKKVFTTLIDYERNKDFLNANRIIYIPLKNTGLVYAVVLRVPNPHIPWFFFVSADMTERLDFEDVSIRKLIKSAKKNTFNRYVLDYGIDRYTLYFTPLSALPVDEDAMIFTVGDGDYIYHGRGALFYMTDFPDILDEYGAVYVFVDPMVGATVIPAKYVHVNSDEDFSIPELNYYHIFYYDGYGFRRIWRKQELEKNDRIKNFLEAQRK